MSSEERKRILQMVEDGRITADQAMTLIKAIEESAGDEAPALETGPGLGSAPTGPAGPDLEETAAQARRLSQIPLIGGLVLLVASALGMYAVMRNAGYNFWFYCLTVPLLLGAAVTALGGWSLTARWLIIRVDRTRSDEWPKRILLGVPLPLELAGWFLRTFGSHIGELKHTYVDEVVQAISMTKSIREPLIVNVDEGEDGERVQVYIG
jgi:hypothetical protein